MRQDIIERRIGSGIARLDASRELLDSVDAQVPDAAQLIWRVAQWVDVGWGDASVVRCMLARFPARLRGRLTLRDYAAIRIAEGLAAMSFEDPDQAIRHFNTVLVFGEEAGDTEILAIAHFWKARCLRQRGEYDDALIHTNFAYKLASDCGFERMAAVMRVLESWLCFQKGKHKEALKILAETEPVLAETDDAVVLGNIQSTYGRIYRQEGRYHRAIEHFTAAIEAYRKLSPNHPHLARTLANLGYVKRLVALQLRRQIDADLARRRTEGGRRGSYTETTQPDFREQFASLCDEAFAHLDEAAVIYGVMKR